MRVPPLLAQQRGSSGPHYYAGQVPSPSFLGLLSVPWEANWDPCSGGHPLSIPLHLEHTPVASPAPRSSLTPDRVCCSAVRPNPDIWVLFLLPAQRPLHYLYHCHRLALGEAKSGECAGDPKSQRSRFNQPRLTKALEIPACA